jgi:hypothetical protein
VSTALRAEPAALYVVALGYHRGKAVSQSECRDPLSL